MLSCLPCISLILEINKRTISRINHKQDCNHKKKHQSNLLYQKSRLFPWKSLIPSLYSRISRQDRPHCSNHCQRNDLRVKIVSPWKINMLLTKRSNRQFQPFQRLRKWRNSVGITPGLSVASRIILIITMFAGRVGPLTLTMALAGTRQKKRLVKNVEASMMIG